MNKVYQIVTDQVCDMLKKGTIPWRKPWHGGANQPMNILGRRYNGINWFLLNMLPYGTPVFATFKQIEKMGGTIRKGEHGHPVYYYGINEKVDSDGKKVKIPVFRFTKAWNVEQCDNLALPQKIQDAINPDKAQHEPITEAEAIVNAMPNAPVMIRDGISARAFYRPSADSLTVPKLEQFDNRQEYYSTLFHEMGHSTGHASRLNRKEVTNLDFFGSHNYSVEELVAEFTAAFLCAECGIDNTLQNSSAYIQSWLNKLQADPKMLMMGASRAQKAADYILNRHKDANEVTE